MSKEFKDINRCIYYRESEKGNMGRGLGFCDLDGFSTICDGDEYFCEKPDELKIQQNRKMKAHGTVVKDLSNSANSGTTKRRSSTYDVLVVDDESQIRTLVAKILSSRGYRCEEAENGFEALRILDNQKFDVIISDIVMPGMDGITFMKEVFKKYPDMPIMIMTGFSDEYTADEAIRFGAREFIKKPFTVIEFIIRFSKMMKEYEIFQVIEKRAKDSEYEIERLNKEIGNLKSKLKMIH